MNYAGLDAASSGREAEGRDTDKPESTGAHMRWIFDTVKGMKMNPTG